ncbi:MAG: sialidase [Planctomycetaceae bacterium]|nr:MAG: sialidase [Planctomycetaceae bacterium]
MNYPIFSRVALAIGAFLLTAAELPAQPPGDPEARWGRIAPFFSPPDAFADDFGPYRSPLKFADGREVTTAEQWDVRRREILATWHEILGPWPDLITQPTVEILETEQRGEVTQHKVRFAMTDRHPTTGYLLIPPGEGERPAVVVVYYEPETAIGRGKSEARDFAIALARRGFVTLSIGIGASLYYPDRDSAQLQPLSALGYFAANAWYVLAQRPEVDDRRIGIVGHSYGGKWAMFASCLFDKFACAAWSDGGVVFDESRGNVNYWEPWYLGYEPGQTERRGIPGDDNPRAGAYRVLVEQGHDLHELHALMAPRPFLVSGGAEDQPHRWRALNHSVAVNRLLGHEHRVAMTNRPSHGPTPESNEQMYQFFEHFLQTDPAKPEAD